MKHRLLGKDILNKNFLPFWSSASQKAGKRGNRLDVVDINVLNSEINSSLDLKNHNVSNENNNF